MITYQPYPYKVGYAAAIARSTDGRPTYKAGYAVGLPKVDQPT
jgi:hypothetical protein